MSETPPDLEAVAQRLEQQLTGMDPDNPVGSPPYGTAARTGAILAALREARNEVLYEAASAIWELVSAYDREMLMLTGGGSEKRFHQATGRLLGATEVRKLVLAMVAKPADSALAAGEPTAPPSAHKHVFASDGGSCQCGATVAELLDAQGEEDDHARL